MNSVKEMFQVSVEAKKEEAVAAPTLGCESLEAAFHEVAEVSVEMAATEQAIEEMTDIATGLEGLVAHAEASLEHGGLTAKEAAILDMAAASYTGRLGIEDSVVASVESFGGESECQEATQVSVESIKEKLKQIWDAIKATIAKAIKFVSDLLAKIFGGTKKLKERTKAMRKSIKALKGKAPKTIPVVAAATMHYNGKVDVSDVVAGMDKTKDCVESMNTNYLKDSADLVKGFDAALELKENADTEEYRTAMAKGIQEAGDTAEELAKRGTFSGGRGIEATFKNDAVSVSVKNVFRGTIDSKTEVDAPSEAEMLKMLDLIDAFCKTIEKEEKAITALGKARDAGLKKVDSWVKKNSDGKVSDATVKMVTRYASYRLQKTAMEPIAQLNSHAFSVSRGALSMIEKTIAGYGEDKKEEK